MTPEDVRILNKLGHFSFCGFACDRARIKKGVFQVRAIETFRQDPGWMSTENWLRAMHPPEDYLQALRTAFSHNGNGFLLPSSPTEQPDHAS